jgi:hypothetical protein
LANIPSFVHIKTVKLKESPFDIAFISRTDQYVVTLPFVYSMQFMNKDLTLDKCIKVKCTNIKRTVEPVVVLIESSKAFHFPFAFQLFLLMLKLMALYLYYL